MFSHYYQAFIASFMLISLNLFGEVVPASNLDVIQSKINTLDEQALVVFDVDFTLISPKDRILQAASEEYYQLFVKKLRAMNEEGATLGSRVALKAESGLVDPCSLSMLERLKNRQIKTIALTAMTTGRFGDIPSMEDFRVNQLRNLGIDFSWSFPQTPCLIFDEFQKEKSLPVFKQGILASAKVSKGDALVALLNKLKWNPSQILFIDDRMEYVTSVESALEQAGIPHTSFHYTQAMEQSEIYDKELADFQYAYLLENRVWLSDSEAKLLMEKH